MFSHIFFHTHNNYISICSHIYSDSMLCYNLDMCKYDHNLYTLQMLRMLFYLIQALFALFFLTHLPSLVIILLRSYLSYQPLIGPLLDILEFLHHYTSHSIQLAVSRHFELDYTIQMMALLTQVLLLFYLALQ